MNIFKVLIEYLHISPSLNWVALVLLKRLFKYVCLHIVDLRYVQLLTIIFFSIVNCKNADAKII